MSYVTYKAADKSFPSVKISREVLTENGQPSIDHEQLRSLLVDFFDLGPRTITIASDADSRRSIVRARSLFSRNITVMHGQKSGDQPDNIVRSVISATVEGSALVHKRSEFSNKLFGSFISYMTIIGTEKVIYPSLTGINYIGAMAIAGATVAAGLAVYNRNSSVVIEERSVNIDQLTSAYQQAIVFPTQ